ncbi:PAQR family membrane homeostasis protein TrhA [Engelhardtia mirabilis]|uniref:Hemolysin-III related n=1 Tax=Engelhardtia mirabilis TaxID=2528011 RepID=A0A518BGW0_9BACT|nr:hemolysin-III related [Planctomycetes bacterium Pla133]QDV00480.1 hemolysin-III related [Planctomycetes bacterium Pla86]
MTAQVTSIPGFHEPFNAISHLGGAVVFAVLTVPLLRRASGDWRRTFSLSVFAFTSVFLLSMSGVYHLLSTESTGRDVLGRLDQAGIFALIAGTHTPIQTFFFRGFRRWGVLAAMWLVAATGITLFAVYYDSLPRGIATSVYLTMGWIAGAAGLVVWRRAGSADVRLLILGGVTYSAGAVMLALDWPNLWPGVFEAHELWHVAVLCALTMHWRFFMQHARMDLDGDPQHPHQAPR